MPLTKEMLKRIENNDPLLQTLDVGGSRIGNADTAHIKYALKTNTFLRSIDMSRCRIGSTGASHVAAALKSNIGLKSIIEVTH